MARAQHSGSEIKRVETTPIATCAWRSRVCVVAILTSALIVSTACGGGSSPSPSESQPLTGNWQFTQFATPLDNSFSGGMVSGFLQQNKGAVTGQFVYAITMPGTPPILCDGSANVTGTVNGQSVTLTATAGSQTITLNGTLSADGKTMTGTYATIATSSCGTAQSGSNLSWSASLIPSLTGSAKGNLHSTGPTGISPLIDQDFQVTGSLTQGSNIGASSATVSGTLNFEGYPCLSTASVVGTISGTSAILQLVAINGSTVGAIGAPASTSGSPAPVTFNSSSGGNVLQGANGYGVSTNVCPGNANSPGDVGNICLDLGTGTACTQVLSLSPATLTFGTQPLGSSPLSQTITLTNTGASGATLNGLQLSPTGSNFTPTDFNGLPNYTEQDNCSTTPGSTFSLNPQQSCMITILFSPQESCPWLPSAALGGASPLQCPPYLFFKPSQPVSLLAATVTLTVSCSGANCPTTTSPDNNPNFAVPISGFGISAIQPSTPELDFGAEDSTSNEVSQPQALSFINNSASPIQILPAVANFCGTPGSAVTPARPAVAGTVPGLQIASAILGVASGSVQYFCDLDSVSGKPSFQIVPGSDTCTGTLLAPKQTCSAEIVYAPQPDESAGGLNYFLQFNTLECTSSTTADCEIDSGRFPVLLKSSLASPIRLSPGAGLDFGEWPEGQTSDPPLTVTVSNDASVAAPQAINFQAIATNGDYAQTNNCPVSMAPGGSCTFTITFTPKKAGFDPGSIVMTYNNGQVQTINLRGLGQ